MAFLVAAFLTVSLLAFFATGAYRRRTARVAQASGSPLLSVPLMEYGLWVLRPVARAATALRVSPDLLSWGSLLFHLGAGLALAHDQLDWAMLWLLLGGACDSLDGTVARALGVASDAGECLDAVIDRWSEMAVWFGLAYRYRELSLGFWLALWAAAGSMMISYTRAKSQAMGVKAGGGLMPRHERASFFMAGVLIAAVLTRVAPRYVEWPLLSATALIAVLSTLGSMFRTMELRATLRARP